jgi:hypothetical protein
MYIALSAENFDLKRRGVNSNKNAETAFLCKGWEKPSFSNSADWVLAFLEKTPNQTHGFFISSNQP